jgi:hypothetical protein
MPPCLRHERSVRHDHAVARELDYFFERGAGDSDALANILVRGLDALGVEASLTEVTSGTNWPEGLDWVSGELLAHGQATGIDVEIHADDVSVNAAWDEVAHSPGAPERPASLGLCTLTLSGEVDWAVLEVVRSFLRQSWAAAEHDEADGFTPN